MNLGVFDLRCNSLTRQPVVDPPADVAGTGATPGGPPGVGIGFVGVGAAVGVDEAILDEIVETLALLWRESSAFFIVLRPREVCLLYTSRCV